MRAEEALERYFGHTSFRKGQGELVAALLARRDALGVMPTGAGKSICYQVPALLLPGLTIVVSPLISLMKDQVTALRQAGVSGAYLNSSLTAAQYRQVLDNAAAGRYKLLYVSPERLELPDFARFAQSACVSMVAVDEAHCVSQWGQDFRPSYLKIPAFVDALRARPVVCAFTATATAVVKDDIRERLRLNDPLLVTTGFDRPNLFFDVVRERHKLDWLLPFVQARREQSGVVYCATRKNVETVCDALRAAGVPATRYHAGLSNEERARNQEAFVYDRARVMAATNAFGMGIDKSNISYVVHYNMPKDVESYYQEAGRAGRDGSPADCVLLFSPADVVTNKMLIRSGGAPADENEREETIRRELERLDTMTRYCRTTDCLRAFILRYFGEETAERCGHCGNCTAETRRVDATTDAQMLLSCVRRIEKRLPTSVGLSLVVTVMRGANTQRVRALGLNELPTFGLMRDRDRAQVSDLATALLTQGYLEASPGAYPVVRTTEKANGVLFQGEPFALTVRADAPALAPSAKRPSRAARATDAPDLYERLRALRAELAQKEHVPAYLVFSNATLTDMTVKQPVTRQAFRGVSGVGEAKANRYAEAFIAVIARYLRETGARKPPE